MTSIPLNKAVISQRGRMPVIPVPGRGKNASNVPIVRGAPAVVAQTRATYRNPQAR